MNCADVQKKLQGLKYPKELPLGKDKLIFYYNNKSKAEEGGVFVYRTGIGERRPERKSDLYNYFAEGKTSAFSGVPNYTLDLHRTLFDSGNKLF